MGCSIYYKGRENRKDVKVLMNIPWECFVTSTICLFFLRIKVRDFICLAPFRI